MRNPVITLLTDFGTTDHYVAAMKGVVLDICPKAQLIDISHDITPYAVAEAAYTLAQAWRYFPAGTVHLVVVDPGVGSARRPILVESHGYRFVAPDNGVLTMALAGAPKPRFREITSSRYFRKPVSRTFHGRDIFAPVAAHLAAGILPARFGGIIADPVQLQGAFPVQISARKWSGKVLKIDRFGNIVTNLDWPTWERLVHGPFELQVGSRAISRLATAYADVADRKPFLIRGSADYIEISVNQGSAASVLGVGAGAPLELRIL